MTAAITNLAEQRQHRLRTEALAHSRRLAAMPGPRADERHYPPSIVWRRHPHANVVLQGREASGYGETVSE